MCATVYAAPAVTHILCCCPTTPLDQPDLALVLLLVVLFSLCSLRDQLLFPLAASTKGDALDSELVRVLHEVHLPDLVKRFKGGLDEECDWSDTLSVGEQQRIAFARLLVRRPQMAFLDEATSALDTANERRLYSLMRQHVSSFVSVGHRPSLLAFHTHVLFYDEDKCSWKLVPVSEHTAHIPRAD